MSHHKDAPITTSLGSTPAANNNNNNNNNLVVILAGPTGVGKSDVAAQLLSQREGMIVSADSVQAYRGVMIGANKPTAEERLKTPHMLVDVVDHHTPQYNAAEWQRDALYVISTLLRPPQQSKGERGDIENVDKNNTEDETRLSQNNSGIDENDENDENDHISWFGAMNGADRERRREIDKAIADAKHLVLAADHAVPSSPLSSENDKQPILLPVVVGGTMMYLQWLVHGRPDAAKPSPQAVKQASEEMAAFQIENDWEAALKHVAKHGPIFARRLTKLCGRDWYRLRRTLEIALTAQQQQQQQQQQQHAGQDDHDNSDNKSAENANNQEALIEKLFTGEREGRLDSYGYDVRCFFLCPDNRMKHSELVDERCEVMVSGGLISETARLRLAGQLPEMAARAIGYRQTLDYLERESPKDNDEDAFFEYLNQFTTATRRYSKKQMQWFRKDESFVFVPVAIADTKAKRVNDAAQAIEEMLQLPRSEYERQCFSEESMSAKTMKENEAQGKGMKFYQFKRYILEPGTQELEIALAEADRCTNQIQAKKHRVADDRGG